MTGETIRDPVQEPDQRVATQEATQVGVILTCHNRRAKTVACLKAIEGQRLQRRRVQLQVIVVDDGSSDGTAESVCTLFPNVRCERGSGELYWGGGMRLAQQVLLEEHHPDYVLWLNDDVVLDPDGLEHLLQLAGRGWDVVVGALRDPETGELTYGGYKRGTSPLDLTLVRPGREQKVDTFNGNVVLLALAVVAEVGAIDVAFRHQYGDIDYGYRVRDAGFAAATTERTVGTCARNSYRGSWRDDGLALWHRLTKLHSTKEMSPNARWVFARRHAGHVWMLWFAAGYVRAYLELLGVRSPR